MLRRTVALALIGTALLAGCGGSSATEPPVESRIPAPGLISGDAVVRYVDLEGGFYAIVTADRGFDPTNLPAEYQRDGLAVRFAGRPRADLVSYHQYGTIIELTHISRR